MSAFEHGRQQGVGCVDETAKVGVDDGVVIIYRHALERTVSAPSSVVDEDVDTPRGAQDGRGPFPHLLRVGHVAWRHQHRRVGGGDFITNRVETVSPPPAENQVRAPLPQQEGQITADTTAGTGDDDDGIAIVSVGH